MLDKYWLFIKASVWARIDLESGLFFWFSMALHGGQIFRPGWCSGVSYLPKASGKIDEHDCFIVENPDVRWQASWCAWVERKIHKLHSILTGARLKLSKSFWNYKVLLCFLEKRTLNTIFSPNKLFYQFPETIAPVSTSPSLSFPVPLCLCAINPHFLQNLTQRQPIPTPKQDR